MRSISLGFVSKAVDQNFAGLCLVRIMITSGQMSAGTFSGTPTGVRMHDAADDNTEQSQNCSNSSNIAALWKKTLLLADFLMKIAASND